MITVMPRVDDSLAVWRHKLIPGIYDYAAIGAAVDRLRVMAYDQHAPNTGAGPIAGKPWVEAVARYAASKVAPAKVELGVPLYGRDWSKGGCGTVTSAQAVALRTARRAKRQWSRTEAAPYFTYRSNGVRHTVWYSDAASVTVRVRLARRLGLAGVAFWAPGQESRGTWPAVRRASAATLTS